MAPQMSTVWIAMRGENHEGGAVLGVFNSKTAARERALAEKTYFAGGWLVEDDLQTTSLYQWSNGCDWVRIEKFEVQ
jgi:hypothetical protein